MICLNRLLVKFKSSGTRFLQTKSVRSLLESEISNDRTNQFRVVGWIRSVRDQKDIKFFHLKDGSDERPLQLVMLMKNYETNRDKLERLFSKLHFNTSVEVIGKLMKSEHKKQNVELHVQEIELISECDPLEYPFKQKSNYNLEQIRQHVHLRSHNDIFANIMRFRSELTFSFSQFFHQNSFIQIQTPVLTTNNCEGGCETFQATTKHTSSTETGFFSSPVYLTASAQLHLETMTTSLAKVYTLSPTFRAEKSMTRHHLAEFYMLEVELIDMNNLEELLDLTEKMIKQVIINTFKNFNSSQIFEQINKSEYGQMKGNKKNKIPKDYKEFILNLAQVSFKRITYRAAIDLLNEKKPNSIKYGDDFNKEQEKLLTEYFDQTPVFVTNYPKILKPFYMRQNLEQPDLVDNFDLLAPYVGEIVGGSLREFRYDLLLEAMERQKLNLDDYKSYLETKKFGSMKMGGFGLGLERLIQFLLNIENIKDTCAFPRSIYNCKM